MPSKDAKQIYCDNINNNKVKMAFFLNNYAFDNYHYVDKCPGIFLEERWMVTPKGFLIKRNHILFNLVEYIVQHTFDTGVLQHLRDFNDYFVRKIVPEIEDDEPKVLALKDLAFGFNIWLVAIGCSCIVFVLKLLHFQIKVKVRRHARRFIGNTLVLLNLLQWLKRYHR
jgi:hypothetical protein